MSMPRPGVEPPTTLRRIARWAVRGGLAVVGLGLAFVLVHAVMREPVSPTAVYERELGEPPPSADNGFVDLQAYMRTRTTTASVPPEVRRMVGGADGPRLPGADLPAKAGELEGFLASEPARSDAVAFERALARPVFADPCAIDVHAECRVISLVAIHDAYAAKLLLDATRTPEAAAEAAFTLVERDLAFVGTGRSLIVHVIAVRNASSALRVLFTVLERLPVEARAAYRPKLARVPLEALSAERAAKAELVLLRSVLRGDWGEDMKMFRLAVIAFDPGRTERDAVACARPLLDALRAHQPLPPPCPSPTEGFGWWLYNPAGKLILGGTRVTNTAYEKFEVTRATMLRERAAFVGG